MSRITAIVPAHNEAPRIGAVLEVLTTYPGFDEILVVDDGSTDGTADCARQYAVRVLQNPTNLGKGTAMDYGVREAQGDIIFFADADIVGLTHQMIDSILFPVLHKGKEMCIGMHNRKIYATRIVLSMIPLLGGERALTKSLWQKLPDYYKQKFRIEPGLNFYAKYFGRGYTYVMLSGITRIKKERKYGLWDGFSRRVAMYEDIVSAEWRLALHDLPPTLRSQKLEIISFLGSLLGITLGLTLFFLFDNSLFKTIGEIVVVSNLAFALLKFRRVLTLVTKG